MEFEATKEDIHHLREWLQKKSHIIQDYDDEFLSALVRVKKRRLQKTKLVLEHSSALGMKYPEFFGTYDPLNSRLQDHFSIWFIFPLPKKTPDGATVFFTCLNPNGKDASKSHINEYYKYLLLSFYVLLWENNFGSGQWHHVADCKGCKLGYMSDLTPTNIKKIIKIAESGIPLRLKSISFYNVPTIMEQIFYLFKLVSKTKLAERIFVYGTADKLTEIIPQKMLPKEYGGGEESVFVLHENWKKKVESYRGRLLEEERKMRELDHLRPQTDDDDDDDEMAGTFRRLNVD